MKQLVNQNVLTMSSREIADLVDARHNDVLSTIERLFSKNLLRSSRKSRREATGGRPIEVYDLIERDTHLVVAGYSDEHRAKVIDRWQELEDGAKQVTQVVEVQSKKIAGELAIMECFTRLLNPSQSSQIMMLGKIAENNGLNAGFLPAYAIDAAPDATGGSSMVTKPLTALLKQYCIDVPAAAFNWKLRDHGFIRQQSRVNSKNQTVHFWSITDKGLRYGKNLTSPRQPRETQPHWYEDTFAELLKVVVQQGEK